MDKAVPDGADGRARRLLRHARRRRAGHVAPAAEWLARAPELEEETALANIALDLLGQARLLLTRAGQVDGTGRAEDDFAFFRDAGEFRNVGWRGADADSAG